MPRSALAHRPEMQAVHDKPFCLKIRSDLYDVPYGNTKTLLESEEFASAESRKCIFLNGPMAIHPQADGFHLLYPSVFKQSLDKLSTEIRTLRYTKFQQRVLKSLIPPLVGILFCVFLTI